MNIHKVQLITTRPDIGRSPGDGVYPPCGLLTIARTVQRELPGVEIVVDDQHRELVSIRPDVEVVGIQVASTLCYGGALELAQQAKAAGKIVVLGGPHVTSVYDRILPRRPNVDFIVRGKGEEPFAALLRALQGGMSLEEVPALGWRDPVRGVAYNPESSIPWQYDNYAPLPLECLSAGIGGYWQAFREGIDPAIDAAFVLFTHFGCGYKDARLRGLDKTKQLSPATDWQMNYCSFCSLDDPPQVRDAHLVLNEVREYLLRCDVPSGARVHLRCYGDNIGPQRALLKSLVQAVEECPWWSDYNISWAFYCQSLYITESVMMMLKRIGTTHLFIGFDGMNDEVQRINGLGTSQWTHERAVDLCEEFGIKIQAGSVVGLMGETPGSLEESYRFFKSLWHRGVLERINSAMLFIIPGTPAYELLVSKEPTLRDLDMLPTQEIQALWVKYFCPAVSMEMLQEHAQKIGDLSPGAQGSLGFASRLI